MAMVVAIDNALGVTPTWTAVGATTIKWNTLDDLTDTAHPIATPTSTGTNFSFIKTFAIDITTTNSLTMTGVKFGKVANETTTGTKLWNTTEHSGYTQATAAPTATGDNNVTAPAINSGSSIAAVPLISGATQYSAGPHTTTGRKGNMVEVTLGVDSTNTTAGTAVATPTLRWSWTES